MEKNIHQEKREAIGVEEVHPCAVTFAEISKPKLFQSYSRETTSVTACWQLGYNPSIFQWTRNRWNSTSNAGMRKSFRSNKKMELPDVKIDMHLSTLQECQLAHKIAGFTLLKARNHPQWIREGWHHWHLGTLSTLDSTVTCVYIDILLCVLMLLLQHSNHLVMGNTT